MGVLKAKVGGAWVDVGYGPDEVWIDTNPPTAGLGYELWVDTDAESATNPTVTPNAGNALGIVAVGAIIGTQATYTSGVLNMTTTPATYTLTSGRRYRVLASLRALGFPAGGGHIQAVFYDNGVSAQSTLMDAWRAGPASLNDGATFVSNVINGDGAGHSYELRIMGGTANTICYGGPGSTLYLEDMGPINRVTPVDPISETTVPWIALPLSGSWTNYGAGFNNAGYRKVHDRTELRGLVKSGTGAIAAGEIVGTVPVGYRPLNRTIFLVAAMNGTERVDVYADGTIVTQGAMSGTPARDWMPLEQMSWSVT